MLILGCDVGSRNFGCALLRVENDKISIEDLQFIYLKASYIGERLETLEESITKFFFERYKVSKVVYEHPILRGANTADVLYTCGVIHKLSFLNNLKALNVSPSHVKKTIGLGGGKSSKKDVLDGLTTRVSNLNDYPQLTTNDHLSDAVAIALCGL